MHTGDIFGEFPSDEERSGQIETKKVAEIGFIVLNQLIWTCIHSLTRELNVCPTCQKSVLQRKNFSFAPLACSSPTFFCLIDVLKLQFMTFANLRSFKMKISFIHS